MEDNDIFVNLKYGDQIELTDVISTNEGFPSYEDFIESAQRTFDITHPIYFANQVNARLREKIFEKYVKKFLNNSDFILYVKDEDPLNKKDDSRAGPSTSISSNINRSRNSLQSVNQNSPKSVESDSLAYEEVTMQEVLHIDVVPKQEPMQDVLPEIVLIENNIPEKPDSSSMQNFASTSDFDSMPLKNRKRPVPLDRDSIRNPNNFNMEKMTANDKEVQNKMEDNDIFVNLKYGDQIELTDVISTNEGFPSYEDFIESAQRTFDITHPIYFANQVNARLREKIFEKYVKKFLNNSDFILYVKDEDPLNKKDDSRAGPSTSISSNINRSRNSLQSVNQNSPKSVESDSLAYEDVTMQEVLHIDVVPKQEPMQDVLPEIVLIENNIPEKPDSSSMQNFASTSDFDSMPLKNRKRPVPLDRDSIRNPNNFNMEKMTANDLRNYIYESGGQNIFHEYERDGTLCEASRKQFIRIVAQHLTANFGFYSGKETKIAYAKLCVQLLPKYKTSSAVNYVRKTSSTIQQPQEALWGDKLHYLQSKCRRQGNGVYLTKKRREAQQAEMSANAASKQKIDEETVLANIEFIKNATIQDKDQIIQAFKANREHRLVNSNTIVDDYINAFRLVPS
uniref:Uncharacterized protein n=1 Tax=Lutzomyia longipalpis TaxID=7200 RepID=A0A1B0GHR6_LUTLO